MKKLISLFLVFGMLLTFCACNQDPALESNPGDATDETPGATEETVPFWQQMLIDPNAVNYDEIDENVPEDGEYRIHTAEGLKNIAKYPDAKFKILRDIDLEGAEWTPVEKFTGTLNGQNFKIKNFTISTPAADGNMAFIGINEGVVMNVMLENVTITTNEQTVNAGAHVAVNKGIMRRNGAAGTLVIEKTAEAFNAGGAAAVNENVLESQDGTVDIKCSASSKGNIGGLVAVQQGGRVKSCMASGNIYVNSGADKLVGIFCAKATDVVMEDNGYSGTAREVDGNTLENLFGVEENVTNTGWALRDPVPELSANQQAKRDRVAQEVWDLSHIEWTVSQPLTLDYDCGCCDRVTFMPGVKYRGVPYNHKNGSLTRMEYFLDENNVIKDFCYEAGAFDGWDIYIGNDCSTGFLQALAVVCNDCDFSRSKDQFPGLGNATNMAVGGWDEISDVFGTDIWVTDSGLVIDQIGEEAMLECYAQMRKGDGLGSCAKGGGHCRMVIEDPVVMRDENGKIDPEKSYCIEIDNVANFAWVDNNSFISSWRQNKKTFAALLEVGMLPLTWEELNNDDPLVTPEITVEETVDGRFGLTTGIVTSNVYLDSVSVVIADDAGNELFNKRMFTTADKRGDPDLEEEAGKSEDRVARRLLKTFDLVRFATPLRNFQFEQGKTYTAKIIGHTSSGFDVVVRELTF